MDPAQGQQFQAPDGMQAGTMPGMSMLSAGTVNVPTPPPPVLAGSVGAAGGGGFAGGGGGGGGRYVATGTEVPQNQKIEGTVKAWMDEKGFGFVTPPNGVVDIFVHRNQLVDGTSLVVGAPAVFECRFNPSRRKYEATSCSGAVNTGAAAPPMPQTPGLVGVVPGYQQQQQQLGGLAGLAGGVLGGFPGAVAGVGAMGGCGAPAQDNLFVAGLPTDFDEERVRQLFSQYGSVSQVKVLPDTPGKPDKAALVRFGDPNQAKWMVDNMNGNIPVGMSGPVTVQFASSGQGQGPGGYGKAQTPQQDPRFSPYGGAMAGGAGAADPNAALAALSAAVAPLVSVAAGAGLAPGGVLPPPPPPAPAAAAQWLEAQDPSTGKTYYYNSVTRETRWDKPM